MFFLSLSSFLILDFSINNLWNFLKLRETGLRDEVFFYPEHQNRTKFFDNGVEYLLYEYFIQDEKTDPDIDKEKI